MVLVQCSLKRRDPSLISFSKVLGPRGGGLSTYEKELKAILLAVDRWRHYLPFTTLHQSGNFLLEQKLIHPLQLKALAKLSGLSYTIEYKKELIIEWRMPCLEG
jgi:hypothetical protein